MFLWQKSKKLAVYVLTLYDLVIMMKIWIWRALTLIFQFQDEEVSPRQSRAAFSGKMLINIWWDDNKNNLGMRGRRAPFNGMRGKRGPSEEDYEVIFI